MSNLENVMQDFQNEVNTRIQSNMENESLRKSAEIFMRESFSSKYSYNFSWLGRPIIQYPQDIVAVQELIWKYKPDLIIETGIAHGGSLILSASMLSLIEYCDAIKMGQVIDPSRPKGFVIGVDIDIRKHNKLLINQHPMSNRIKLYEGSSVDDEIVNHIFEITKNHKRVMVFLDSNHSHDHVLAELHAYAPFVTKGSYLVVFDTVVDELEDENFKDRPWGKNNNPKTAVKSFLKQNCDFEIDSDIDNQLVISVAKGGFLKRL